MIMLTNGRTGRFTYPPTKPKPPTSRRHTVAVLSAVLVVAVAVGVGVVAEKHLHQPSGISPKAAQLKPVRLKAKPVRPVGPPSSWKLAFDASFHGDSLDTNVWGTCYPWDTTSLGCTNYGANDIEREWYLPSQDQVSGGVLHLTAQQEPTAGLAQDGAPKEYTCRSGMVTTYPGLQFTYGFLQITAQIPNGKGLWPALWLAAANEAWPPEIDILEHWDAQTNVGIYFHPATGARQGGRFMLHSNLSKGWHTITLEWTKTSLTWYYDGHQMFTTTKSIPQQSMYLIMNLADTTAAGTCDGTMLIKSVKLWQP